MFKYGRESRAYESIKIRTVLELEQTADGVDNSKRIADIDSKLFGRYSPPSFRSGKSAEITHDKSFEKLYVMISKEFGLDKKDMTVLSFYSSMELLKEQNDSKMKTIKNK